MFFRNPQRTMTGGSEDVMHKWTEKSPIPIYSKMRCCEAPDGRRTQTQNLHLRRLSELRRSVLSVGALALLLMLTRALFVSLCCQQIDGAAARIDRSSSGSHSSPKASQTRNPWEGKSVVRKTLAPLQLAPCHFGVRRQPIMSHLTCVCGAALKHF